MAPEAGTLLGIAAPHVSPDGGWRSYAAAYGALTPDLRDRTFVILGTSHYGMPGRFGLTRKPFATPFGVTTVDTARVDALAAAGGPAVVDEDYCHAVEHSIEFQVVFLQHLYGPGVRILPILCGPLGAGVGRPAPRDDAEVQRFLATLSRVCAPADEVVWILGIDMAHIGQRYGDGTAVVADEGPMRDVARAGSRPLRADGGRRPGRVLGPDRGGRARATRCTGAGRRRRTRSSRPPARRRWRAAPLRAVEHRPRQRGQLRRDGFPPVKRPGSRLARSPRTLVSCGLSRTPNRVPYRRSPLPTVALLVLAAAIQARPAATPSPTPSSAPLAVLDGQPITAADIEPIGGANLTNARMQWYNAQRGAVEEAITRRLLEKEAKARNISLAELHEGGGRVQGLRRSPPRSRSRSTRRTSSATSPTSPSRRR